MSSLFGYIHGQFDIIMVFVSHVISIGPTVLCVVSIQKYFKPIDVAFDNYVQNVIKKKKRRRNVTYFVVKFGIIISLHELLM